MAHNLNVNQKTGRVSFFTVKEKAWHNLGTILKECPNSQEAIKLAGLDYEVDKTQIYCRTIDEALVEVKGKYATYRTDTGQPFGVVGSRYAMVQNRDAFSFFDAIVGEGAAIYETAGALHDGQTIFITAKLPDFIQVANNDLIEQYLFLTASHDGSSSITAAFTPVRIVCNNTLNAALGRMSNRITVRHTMSAKENLKQAHKIMGITHKLSVELGDIFKDMAKKSITDQELKKFIQISLIDNPEMLKQPDAEKKFSGKFKNMVSSCMQYAHANATQQMDSTKGTLFGAYNAITGYFGNVREYKSNDSKLSSLMGGTALSKAQSAFDLAIEVLNGTSLQ